MNTSSKPWYKKKRYYVIFGTIVTFINIFIGSEISTPASSVQGINYTTQSVIENKVTQPSVSEADKVTAPEDSNTGLSNSNYYTNTYGNTVHSPAYSEDSSIPAGASAQCGDGTYSFSQSRRGTCSHHGGVSNWF